MESVPTQFSKMAGEAMARGKDREVERRFQLLMLYAHYISLELKLRLSALRDDRDGHP